MDTKYGHGLTEEKTFVMNNKRITGPVLDHGGLNIRAQKCLTLLRPEPNDAQHLADTLEKILTDKQCYQQCQNHALTLAKERYDDMTAARRLTELYGTL